MKAAVGIDLGATNIKGVAATSQGKVLARIMMPTQGVSPRTWRDGVRNAVRELERKLGRKMDSVGVAAPGLAAEDGRSIAFLPERLPGIEGFAWQKHLDVSGPVPVLNDGHAALLGEVWCGAAVGCSNVALFTLGTGVGGAAIVEGRLLRGYLGRAGHFGHMSLDPLGPPDVTRCPGSLEMAIGDCTVASRSGGRFNSNRELLKAAQKGDAQAQTVWIDSVRSLAAAIASIINVLSPECVLIGGGTGKAGTHLFHPLKRFLDEFEWRPGGAKVRVVPAALGDLAGAYGAAWKALNS